jgi:hypothetical protein
LLHRWRYNLEESGAIVRFPRAPDHHRCAACEPANMGTAVASTSTGGAIVPQTGLPHLGSTDRTRVMIWVIPAIGLWVDFLFHRSDHLRLGVECRTIVIVIPFHEVGELEQGGVHRRRPTVESDVVAVHPTVVLSPSTSWCGEIESLHVIHRTSLDPDVECGILGVIVVDLVRAGIHEYEVEVDTTLKAAKMACPIAPDGVIEEPTDALTR